MAVFVQDGKFPQQRGKARVIIRQLRQREALPRRTRADLWLFGLAVWAQSRSLPPPERGALGFAVAVRAAGLPGEGALLCGVPIGVAVAPDAGDERFTRDGKIGRELFADRRGGADRFRRKSVIRPPKRTLQRQIQQAAAQKLGAQVARERPCFRVLRRAQPRMPEHRVQHAVQQHVVRRRVCACLFQKQRRSEKCPPIRAGSVPHTPVEQPQRQR